MNTSECITEECKQSGKKVKSQKLKLSQIPDASKRAQDGLAIILNNKFCYEGRKLFWEKYNIF